MLLMLMLWAVAGRAASLNCPLMLADAAADHKRGSAIEAAQRDLVALKFDPQGIDGVLGSKTREALMSFCEGAQYAQSADLLAMLRTYATVAKAYPNWVFTFSSKEFLAWAGSQADAREILQIRASGDAPKVIWVLDRYRKSKVFVPTARVADDTFHSYSLNAEDFSQLKSTDGLLKRIGQLKGKPYANQDDFNAALEAAFKGVADPERFIRLVQEHAEPEAAQMLNENSLKALKAKGVAPHILQALQPLLGLSFDADDIEDAVMGVFNPVADKIRALEPEIVAVAELSPSGARLTARSRAKLADAHKGDPMVEAVLERLKLMEAVEYQNDKTLSKAVKIALGKEIDAMKAALPDIVGAAVDVTSYSLSNDALAEINEELSKFLVPELYLQLIAGLKDVEYPDGDLLWMATRSRVNLAHPRNLYRQAIFVQIEKNLSTAIDPGIVDKLKGEVPPAVLDQITRFIGQKFEDTKALEAALDAQFRTLAERYDAYREIVLAQARKRHAYDKAKPIQLSGESCNCHRYDMEGEVYAFYPFWRAGEKQNIDFSVMSRFGYYALGFDDNGRILNAARWLEQDTKFIREIRRYNNKVDLVIHRGDWESWNHMPLADRRTALDQLAFAIVDLVNSPLDDFPSKVEPYISLGLGRTAIRANGVTLDFSGYPADPESADMFQTFVRALGEKFRALDRRLAINVMFRSSEIGKGAYAYQKLLTMLDDIRGGNSRVDGTFLILAQEPTSDDKKLLRINIENGLRGHDRAKLLRNIILVLSFDGHSDQQLADDIIYSDDNFAGIGFWTPTYIGDGAGEADPVSKALHKYHLKPKGFDVQESLPVCRFVCPNRWAFRVAFDIFGFALIISGILFVTVCAWRTLFQRYFLYFLAGQIAPFILIAAALLACDPGWAAVSRGNGLLILVIAGVIVYAVWSHFQRKRMAHLP
ncbi:MAG TPA: peptidoglycan-binding domain-containing protein [Rhodocyclaceae bacterium]